MEYVRTGIEALDTLLRGGIPKGSLVMVSGGLGAPTVSFALHLLSSLQGNEEGTMGAVLSEVGRASLPEVPSNVSVLRGNILNNLFRIFFPHEEL